MSHVPHQAVLEAAIPPRQFPFSARFVKWCIYLAQYLTPLSLLPCLADFRRFFWPCVFFGVSLAIALVLPTNSELWAAKHLA